MKKWFPDSLVLIFGIVIVAQIATYLVPAGTYERAEVDGHEMVVPGSYARVAEADREALPPWYFFLAIPKGLEDAQAIIFLVFLVGGVIAVLRRTGAIDAALSAAVRHAGSRPWLLIAVTLVMFGVGSFTIGMGEEYVPLIPILVTMSLAMKMDAIVAMGMVWVPYGIGWATAGLNPFGVVIAQEIAGLPTTSGLGFRCLLLLVFLAVGFQHVYAYARRVQKDPSKSLVADVDYSEGFEMPRDVRLTGARIAILAALVVGIAFFVWGATVYQWYIAELTAIFLAVGLVGAAFGRLTPNETARKFIDGAAEMTSAALLIGFARTIEIVMNDGQIKDTVIDGIASLLDGAGADVSAVGMLGVQTVCNFFIPSGSGQAYVTMPLMSPLATVTGVPQQTAVLAYQFGDGFTNMIVPTSALVMGTLALGRIPYGRWARFVAPLLLKLFAVAILVLIFTVHFADAIGFADPS